MTAFALLAWSRSLPPLRQRRPLPGDRGPATTAPATTARRPRPRPLRPGPAARRPRGGARGGGAAAVEPARAAGAAGGRDVLTNARIEFQKGLPGDAEDPRGAAAQGTEFTPPSGSTPRSCRRSRTSTWASQGGQEHFRELLLTNPDYFWTAHLRRGGAQRPRRHPDRSELQPRLEKRRQEIRLAKQREAEAKKAAEEAERRRRELAAIPEQVRWWSSTTPCSTCCPSASRRSSRTGRAGRALRRGAGRDRHRSVLTTRRCTLHQRSDGRWSPTGSPTPRAGGSPTGSRWGRGRGLPRGVIDAFVAHRDQSVKLVSREEYLRLRDEGGPVPSLPPPPGPQLEPTRPRATRSPRRTSS
jgi:hypothetical protein